MDEYKPHTCQGGRPDAAVKDAKDKQAAGKDKQAAGKDKQAAGQGWQGELNFPVRCTITAKVLRPRSVGQAWTMNALEGTTGTTADQA